MKIFLVFRSETRRIIITIPVFYLEEHYMINGFKGIDIGMLKYFCCYMHMTLLLQELRKN